VAFRPDSGSWPPFTGLRDHTHWTHHTRWDSSGRVINQAQRPVPDKTQYSQETNIYATDGVRTHKTSKQAAADPRLRTRGHRDRTQFPSAPLLYSKGKSYCSTVKRETTGSARKFEVYLCTKTYGVMFLCPWSKAFNLVCFIRSNTWTPSCLRIQYDTPWGKIWDMRSIVLVGLCYTHRN